MAKLATWLMLQSQAVTAAIGLALAAAVALAVISLFWEVERAEPLEGRLVGWGVAETDLGSRRLGYVQAGDRTIVVNLPLHHACRIGDRMTLRRSRLWWGGSRVTAGRVPCPARTGSKP